MTELTHVDLFAGIGGFGLSLERAGAKTVATAEIDKYCQVVLARSFPNAMHFFDVHDVTPEALRDAGFTPERGVVTAGWPCQGNSIAGRRAGLGDERSGLWKEVYRILDENRPAYFVGENVPGLLSVNGGRDIQLILNDLNNLGYLVNLDILDAQFFGVPQRRKRLFFVCQQVTHMTARKTSSSALIIAQFFSEILGLILAGARPPLPIGRRSSASAKTNFADGLRMRMKLFGLDAGPLAWASLLDCLDEGLAKYQRGRGSSDSPRVESDERAPTMDMSLADTATVGTLSSTASSWSGTWAALCELAKLSTTLTPSSPITESTIFSCAQALLSISARIDPSMSLSPSFLPAASSISTVLMEFIDYAKQADREVSKNLAGDDRWIDFIRSARSAVESLGHLGGSGRTSAEILFEREGLSRDSAEGAEAEPQAAGGAGIGANGSRRNVAPTLTARYAKGTDSDATDAMVVTHTHTHTHISTLQGGGKRGYRIDAEAAAGGHLIVSTP